MEESAEESGVGDSTNGTNNDDNVESESIFLSDFDTIIDKDLTL
jgi:hypothetical protein